MLFNNVDLLCTRGDLDLICILIRSRVMEVNFHSLCDKSKNTGAISSNFVVGTLGTVDQHELFNNIGQRSKVEVTGSQMQNCIMRR